ncbi:hypothetical protein [Campylobacter mucosalis]|uniref:Uncharacterized protein n=1 Tax=Campylobacter mucosalis CCUG 21559 TaxID=1032067 RepID=A0A6G5QGX9_9BACT|nr:hypothetical protein [Campylobacter mucosalis]QCD44945.1 hypothetical protein CMUC_1171 [Campylobacter mucosalis CCUG 21559]
MNFKKLHADLKAWKEKNEISLEMSQKGLVANLLEELTEYVRAENEGNVLMQIDALCDIAVFCLNAIEETPNRYISSYEPPLLAVIEIIQHTTVVEIQDMSDFLIGLVYSCMDNIERLGFNPEKCMEETIKQISSRTGKMDYGIGKWVKDKSPEAKAREYQADYESCRK